MKRSFSELEFVDQVRRAMPMAKDIATLGVGDVERYDTGNEHLASRVDELVGHGWPVVPDADVKSFEDYLYGAFALGVALGQLTSPAYREGSCAMSPARRTGARVLNFPPNESWRQGAPDRQASSPTPTDVFCRMMTEPAIEALAVMRDLGNGGAYRYLASLVLDVLRDMDPAAASRLLRAHLKKYPDQRRRFDKAKGGQ